MRQKQGVLRETLRERRATFETRMHEEDGFAMKLFHICGHDQLMQADLDPLFARARPLPNS